MSGYSGDNAPAAMAKLNRSRGLAVDESGILFIADYGNSRVRKVVPSAVAVPDLSIEDIYIEVYPNPASDIVSFTCGKALAREEITITIVDIPGNKVAELHTAGNSGKLYWDASNQPSGMYFYNAYGTGNISLSGKISIVR
jgi:hypothetical protein